MFLAAACKPIFLSNPYPFRAEHQTKVQTHAKVSIYNRQGEMEWVTLQTWRNLSLCEMEGRYLNMMMVVWCCMGPTWWVHFVFTTEPAWMPPRTIYFINFLLFSLVPPMHRVQFSSVLVRVSGSRRKRQKKEKYVWSS
jgi:hypothetical protein